MAAVAVVKKAKTAAGRSKKKARRAPARASASRKGRRSNKHSELTPAIKRRLRNQLLAKYQDLQAQIAELSPSLYLYDQLEKHAVADYVDWKPEANSAVMGYQIFAPRIGVAP